MKTIRTLLKCLLLLIARSNLAQLPPGMLDVQR
jgi:hypothetical protein